MTGRVGSIALAAGLVVGVFAAPARAQMYGYMPDPGGARYPLSPPPRHRKEWVLGPAMGALVMPAAGRTGLAIEFAAFREIDDWAFGLQTTFATTDSQIDSGAQFFAIAFGGRRYFGQGSVGFFVGAGLSLNAIIESGATVNVQEYDGLCLFDPCSTTLESHRQELREGGFGAYGEAGVELFRDHPIRFIVSARVDAPFQSLELDNRFAGDTSSIVGVTRRYEAPVTLNLGVGF